MKQGGSFAELEEVQILRVGMTAESILTLKIHKVCAADIRNTVALKVKLSLLVQSYLGQLTVMWLVSHSFTSSAVKWSLEFGKHVPPTF